jgi:hypothetical protein
LRTAVVGRRRYESVTRSFISHPTSWSFPKRRNDKRERKNKKQGDSLIHSRPIKENKRGAHFFFFKKGKKRKKNHYDIALTGAVTPVQQQLSFFFFCSFF